MKAPSFHDAVAPERSASVDSFGIRIRIYEWGDPAGIPIVLHHGMFDNARGFDRLAPLLAERFRVVALDARGHGESDWAASYPWAAEVGDLVNVLRKNPLRSPGTRLRPGLCVAKPCWSPLQRRFRRLDPGPNSRTWLGRGLSAAC